MGRIVVTEFISLDGVIEAPGGGEDYKHDGWSFEISRGDEGDKFKLDETMSSADALLLGRRDLRGLRRGLAVDATAGSPTSSTRCRSTSSPRRSTSPSGTTRPC